MIIYKYRLDEFASKEMKIKLPVGAKIIHVDQQLSVPSIWVMLDTDELKKKERTFVVVGTGQEFPKQAQHLGTYFDGPFVWHVLETTT